MRQAIGIDLGGTNVRATRISSHGDILEHETQPTADTAKAVLVQIDAMIAALDGPEIGAIGIGVPSRVDVATAEVFPGGYVNLAGPSLARRLAAPHGRPVTCRTDGTMALIAEARAGAARGCPDAVMLTIGTGIGGAAMLGGAVVHGKGTAGQLGHVTVDHAGLPCGSRRRGCLETLSSGTSLGRQIAEAGLPAGTGAEDLLARQDPAARGVIARWIGPLRAGIDTLVACFDPQKMVLGGSLGLVACQALAGFPPTSNWFQTEVAPAQLGSQAGVIGAGLAALEGAV